MIYNTILSNEKKIPLQSKSYFYISIPHLPQMLYHYLKNKLQNILENVCNKQNKTEWCDISETY